MPVMKLCAHDGCRVVLHRSVRFCAYHQQKIVERKTKKIRDYGYHKKHWQTIRQLRLEHAAGYCELRLAGCTIVATHVHLDPALLGDHSQATLNNTKACCLNCSSSVDGGRAHDARAHSES